MHFSHAAAPRPCTVTSQTIQPYTTTNTASIRIWLSATVSIGKDIQYDNFSSQIFEDFVTDVTRPAIQSVFKEQCWKRQGVLVVHHPLESSGWRDRKMERQASLWEFNFGSCVVCCCHKKRNNTQTCAKHKIASLKLDKVAIEAWYQVVWLVHIHGYIMNLWLRMLILVQTGHVWLLWVATYWSTFAFK